MDYENNITQIEPETQPAQPEPETQPAQPEPETQQNPYETIIAQQQAQIDALIAQSNMLTQQITNMVNNGAQFNTQPITKFSIDNSQPPHYGNLTTAQSVFNPKSLAETDSFLSMEDLAKEIGRR